LTPIEWPRPRNHVSVRLAQTSRLEHESVGHIDPYGEARILRGGGGRIGGLDTKNRGLAPLQEYPAADAVFESQLRTVACRVDRVVAPDAAGVEERRRAEAQSLLEQDEARERSPYFDIGYRLDEPRVPALRDSTNT